MAECCLTSPPASSQSLPRSSGEDRPLRCPRCWQSCARPLQTETLNPLRPPLLPWPWETPRPRLPPVSPPPPRRGSRQRWPARCGSDASSTSPISLSRPCPWNPDPQNLNSNLDSLPPQQPSCQCRALRSGPLLPRPHPYSLQPRTSPRPVPQVLP